MASALRSTRLFHQIAQSLGLSPLEPEVCVSQAQAVHDLFMSDPAWKPGSGATIWSEDDKRELREIADPVSPAHLRKISRDNPGALLAMIQTPSLRNMVVVETDARNGDMRILSSVAEEALLRHGDEAARIILSSPFLREQPSMRSLGWVEGRSSLAVPREGCLAFQALDYTGDLSLVFDYPDLWDLPVDTLDEQSESWIARAEALARMRTDPVAYHIHKARGRSAVPVAAPRIR